VVAFLSEADVEVLLLQYLGALGYAIASDAEIGPDGATPERDAYAEVLLLKRLTAAIEKLNPTIPAEARSDALRKVRATEKPSLVEENRRLHKLMVEGVDVEFRRDDGSIQGDKVRLIDFDDLDRNDWLASGQFTVIEGSINRRPDVVMFINGLPLGVVELRRRAARTPRSPGRTTSFRPIRRRSRHCFARTPFWSSQMASPPALARSPPTRNGSCRGAPPTAKSSRQRARRNSAF
jgi:type I site-specific restriction-modification system R (restriction) subunit